MTHKIKRFNELRTTISIPYVPCMGYIYIYINKYPKDDAVVYTVLSENRIPHYIHWLYNQKMTVCLGESPISKQSQLSYDCWLHIFHCILTIIPLYYYLNTSKYQFSLPFPNSRLCFIIILP